MRDLAIEVLGATPFERVGRAPKLALLYRAAPDVVSASYKAANGSGDGLDILAGGRQTVGFGLHAETGLPYRRTGGASPLDARPEAAPVITADQVAEFIVRVEAILPLGGGGAGGGRRKGGGSSSTIVRNAAGPEAEMADVSFLPAPLRRRLQACDAPTRRRLHVGSHARFPSLNCLEALSRW